MCFFSAGKATSDVLKIASSARASPVGPLSPRFNIVKILHNGLNKILPEDAHLICSNRLSVSLTRCRDGQNLMVSNFDSKEELIQVGQLSDSNSCKNTQLELHLQIYQESDSCKLDFYHLKMFF
jgi:hypothetical protein